MLSVALGDNLFSLITPYLQKAAMYLGPKVAEKAWNWAKGT